MTTVIMLALMMGPYMIAWMLSAKSRWRDIGRSAAAIGLGLMFLFTSIGHFLLAEEMAQMLPPWVPERMSLVYLTGILEGALAAGFFVPKTRRIAGWIAFVMLVLFFPANIYAAINHIPMGGHRLGPIYLLLRTPLQLVILFWIYWFTIRQAARTERDRPSE